MVVPVHQVERFLPDCLDSVLGQSHRKLEVVAVDDGSTDGSARILADRAPADDRVRVVRQDNAGLGAARNTGVRHARGEFLAFLDSDDTVPTRAYEQMVASLRESGSDLVVGALAKHEDGRLRVPPWMVPLHRIRRTGVRVDDHPAVVRSIFAVNKLYRRSFWEREQLSFPVGVAYEDHLPITTALLRADTVDVIPEVVYHWRIRQGGAPSITQRKHELANLRDAIATKHQVLDLVDELATPAVRRDWLRSALNDLRPYLLASTSASADYWSELSRGVAGLTDRVGDDVLADTESRLRLLCWLVARDRRSDAVALAGSLVSGSGPALGMRGGRDVVDLPVPADLPAHLLDTVAADRDVRTRLVSVRTDAARLIVRGVAQAVGIADRGHVPTLRLRLLDPDTGAETLLPTSAAAAPVDGSPPRQPGAPPPVGFEAVIDAGALTGTAAPAGPRALEVLLEVGEHRLAGPFSGRTPGALTGVRPPWVVRWTAGPGLHVSLRP